VRGEDDSSQPDRSIRLLLVDDDEDFLDSLTALVRTIPRLMIAGVAHDGLEAIELAGPLEVDAVLIDLHMPLLDGVTALARLRRDHPQLALVAVTGDDDEPLHQAAVEAGADMVIAKSRVVETLPARLMRRLAPR
jgi:DNA-binding NarL/FixJ family response regulator